MYIPTVTITINPIGSKFNSLLMYEIMAIKTSGIHQVIVPNRNNLALIMSDTCMGNVE